MDEDGVNIEEDINLVMDNGNEDFTLFVLSRLSTCFFDEFHVICL